MDHQRPLDDYPAVAQTENLVFHNRRRTRIPWNVVLFLLLVRVIYNIYCGLLLCTATANFASLVVTECAKKWHNMLHLKVTRSRWENTF